VFPCVYTRGDRRGDQGRKRRQSRNDDDGPLILSALVVLSLRPRGEHLVLSLSFFVRSFVRLLVGTIVRPFPLFLLRATLSFLVRSVQVGARRGIQAVIRFVRTRTPAFPIDRSNGTLPHPRSSIARHRVLLSRVYAITRLLHLLLRLILLTLVSLSPALDPSCPPYHRTLCLSDRRCILSRFFISFYS